MDRKVYKIRRLSDGMFSTGGSHPGFNTKGKLWNTIAHLKSHLTLVGHRGLEHYKDCIVVEFEIVQTELCTRSISMFVTDIAAKKERERLEQENRRNTLIEASERQEWHRLNRKYGNHNVS